MISSLIRTLFSVQVLRISTKENTVCRCTGTTFSSTFVVPLNTIDFANVWGKFDPTNAAVYGTLIAFLVIYTITAIYLRRQDKKDEEKVCITAIFASRYFTKPSDFSFFKLKNTHY